MKMFHAHAGQHVLPFNTDDYDLNSHLLRGIAYEIKQLLAPGFNYDDLSYNQIHHLCKVVYEKLMKHDQETFGLEHNLSENNLGTIKMLLHRDEADFHDRRSLTMMGVTPPIVRQPPPLPPYEQRAHDAALRRQAQRARRAAMSPAELQAEQAVLAAQQAEWIRINERPPVVAPLYQDSRVMHVWPDESKRPNLS